MKLYRFPYSPFARKVQMLLDLLGKKYEIFDVSYGERSELAERTGGYVMVPVLVDDAGRALIESRAICQHLLASGPHDLVPEGWEGPIWGYADFCDGPLEDVMFRIASPAVRNAWRSPSDRALYVLNKERKFGPGCVDQWQRDQNGLIARARELLEPTLVTLARRPFVFGDAPTLADTALYGNCIMLDEAEAGLLARVSEQLPDYARRLEGWVRAR